MTSWLLGAARVLLAVQATQPAVVGIVRDGQTGEPLAGAVVALPDIDRTVLTGADGRYALRGVPPGPHHVAVRRIGYTPRTLHALVPRTGEVEINIAMRTVPTTAGWVACTASRTLAAPRSHDVMSSPRHSG